MSKSSQPVIRGRSFIVFLGPVGVGKSTIINNLVCILSATGVRVHKIFIKAFHGLSHVLWSFMVKVLGLPRDYAPWYIIPKCGYVSLARILTIISAYLDVFINIPLKILIIKILRSIGYIVISEEYLYTAIFDYLHSYLALDIKLKSYAKFPILALHSLATKYRPDIVITLDSDVRELLCRWKWRGYGDPQLGYVELQRVFLKKNYFNIDILINTSNMRLKDSLLKVIKTIVKG